MQQDVKCVKVFTPRLTVDKYPSDFSIKLLQRVELLPIFARTPAASFPPNIRT
jgi:hypothetical protein